MKTHLDHPLNSVPHRRRPILGLVILCLAGGVLLLALQSCSGAATPLLPTSTAVSPGGMSVLESNAARLARPILTSPKNPTQLDRGALLYWGVCMACHGDRGQGLTDEWRAVFGEDQNCWASKCHAGNHPPDGFLIPRNLPIPAVIGPGTLAQFTTAQDLYEYIYASMPWWNPGSLSTDQAWSVTANLLNKNRTLPKGLVLDPADAAAVSVHHLVNASQNDLAGEIILALILVIAGILIVVQDGLKRRFEHTASIENGPTPSPVSTRRRPNFFYHLHPPTIPAAQARWRYTLGTGGLAIFLSLTLLVTGILEMFFYNPQADRATISVQTIANLVPYGGLIRNLHFWGAQALVLVLFVHLLRVLITGAYKQPRRFNYLLGLVLLILTLALDFTGYILRWDRGISWALVVGTNLIKTLPVIGNQLYEFTIGGTQPGTATLVRFYSWHIFGLTFAMIVIGIWHIFRIRRDGGIAVPPSNRWQKDERISRGELIRREMLIMTFAGIGLLLLSIFMPAPVTPPLTDVTANTSNARAPWFFLWVQQLLKLGDPFLLGVMVPLILLAILILIPYVFPKPPDEELGRWFPRGGRAVQITIFGLVLFIAVLTVWAILPSA